MPDFDHQVHDDIELMLRFSSGDDEAFDALVGRHKTAAYRVAYHFLHNNTDAEEVALEAFERVWRSRAAYKPAASFTTWFYRIVANLCYNRLRRHGTREARMRAGPEESDLAFETRADNRAPTPAEEVSTRELQKEIQKALSKLPETQRMAVLLSRFEGLSYAETAAALGTTEKAVKSLMARARAALKIMLEHYFEP